MIAVNLEGGRGRNWRVSGWSRGDVLLGKKTKCLGLKEVKIFVEIVVRNTYMRNGCVLKKQGVGIPMGTNAAVMLANAHLQQNEYDFLTVLPIEEARKYQNSVRLIDDILGVPNCLPKQAATRLDRNDKEG